MLANEQHGFLNTNKSTLIQAQIVFKWAADLFLAPKAPFLRAFSA
ncbi:hypothetical protein OAG73_01605 [bacterium]|nr:hypothetical protein [bacterium]